MHHVAFDVAFAEAKRFNPGWKSDIREWFTHIARGACGKSSRVLCIMFDILSSLCNPRAIVWSKTPGVLILHSITSACLLVQTPSPPLLFPFHWRILSVGKSQGVTRSPSFKKRTILCSRSQEKVNQEFVWGFMWYVWIISGASSERIGTGDASRKAIRRPRWWTWSRHAASWSAWLPVIRILWSYFSNFSARKRFWDESALLAWSSAPRESIRGFPFWRWGGSEKRFAQISCCISVSEDMWRVGWFSNYWKTSRKCLLSKTARRCSATLKASKRLLER